MRAARLALAVAALSGCAGDDRARTPDAAMQQLLAAATRGDAARVTQLIEAQPGLARATWEGVDGPLGEAAAAGHLEVIQVLLAAGADPRERGRMMHTPLHRAREPEIVDALLEGGLNPDVRSRDGTTPIMALVHRPKAMERLLERGARTGLRDEAGRTAIHHAAAAAGVDSLRSLAALCGYGADPEIADEKGATARAAASGHAAATAFVSVGGGCDQLRERFEDRGPAPAAERELAVQIVRCETGQAQGCGRLGRAYDLGEGVTQDLARAAGLYRRGCDGEHAWSCYALGFSYRGGEGVTRDDAQAVALFREACDADYVPACGELGWHLTRGRGVVRDDGAAAALLERACGGDDARSCRRLAQAHAEGRGVPRDPARAAQLWRRACQAGDEPSCAKER